MKAKSPLLLAIVASVAGHGLLAFYLQYSHLLDPIALNQGTQGNTTLAVLEAILVPNATLVQKNALDKTSLKFESKRSQDTQKATKDAAAETDAKPLAQAPETKPLEPPNDSEALPHEELARKKEALPAAILPPKEKAAQFSVANQLLLRYEGAWGGTPIKGVLSFQLKNDDYTASLALTASVLFKTFELKQTSAGKLSTQGFETLSAQDKAINGRTTAITVEPSNQRVIISSKEGFLPYSAGGKDLLGLILQLGILSQAQAEWKSKGAAQDFTVYRPSGIKLWRYQSQGIEKIQVGATIAETIYIKRVPQSNEPDFEYIHHFWLDPARHGMPVRIKLEDSKSGRTIDMVLSQWEES